MAGPRDPAIAAGAAGLRLGFVEGEMWGLAKPTLAAAEAGEEERERERERERETE